MYSYLIGDIMTPYCNICGLRHSEQLWYGYRTLYRYEYNKIYLTTTTGIREAVIKYSTWECYRLARYTTYLYILTPCNICGLRHSEQLWYGYRTLYRYEYNKIYLTTTTGIREAVIKYSTWECYRLARYTTYLYTYMGAMLTESSVTPIWPKYTFGVNWHTEVRFG